MRVMARCKDDNGKDKEYLVEDCGQFAVIDARYIKYVLLDNAIVSKDGNIRAKAGEHIETLNSDDFEELLQKHSLSSAKVSSKVQCNGEIDIDIKHTLTVKLSENDIFNWIGRCNNADTLKYLGNYALKCAKSLENPDKDDFRSRA